MMTHNNHKIRSVRQLHVEMREAKLRIRECEEDLGKRLKQLPGEAVKSAVGAILPVILGNQLGSGAWKLVKKFINPGKSEPAEKMAWKDGLISGAAQMGFFTVFKLLSSLWNKRK